MAGAARSDHAGNEPAHMVCGVCARAADPDVDGDPALSWSAEIVATDAGNTRRWTCVTCTRRHVRSIEAKLDPGWW